MEMEEESLVVIEELGSAYWFPEWNITSLWFPIIEEHDYILQFFLDFISLLYESLNLDNIINFFLKVLPSFVCMYHFIKNLYVPSRERIRKKQLEIDDLQLQLDILNSKMRVHDSELEEQAEEVRRATERLHQARARARAAIASDETLRRDLYQDWCDEDEKRPDDECDLILELLKDFHVRPEAQGRMDCGEPQIEIPDSPTVESSLGDGDQGCRVKVVEVTNVYKVSFWKHYIKRRRTKRTSKRTELNEKVENIRKLLKDWQDTLYEVSRTRLPMPLIKADQFEMSSQDGTGDFRPSLRESSGSDSDLKSADVENYITEWQNGNYDCMDCREHESFAGARYPPGCHGNGLSALPEETHSQLQIEMTGEGA